MQNKLQLILFATLFCFTLQLDLPSNFKKCKRSDKNFNGCLKEAMQDALLKLDNGLPEFKFPALQPIKIPEITIGEGATGAVKVVQHFKDVNIYNLTHSKIQKVDAVITPSDFSLEIQAIIPELTWKSRYEITGQIFVLPISGKGQFTVASKSIAAHVIFKGQSYDKKGKTYVKIHSVDMTLTPEDLKLRMDNLFDGNERLGADMNRIINENWKEIWTDLEPNYERVFEKILQNDVNLILQKVPFDQMFLL